MNFDIKTYASLESTQDEALRLLEEGKGAQGLVVQAMTQLNGRGRHGNSWNGPLGNLYLSVVLSPEIDQKHSGQIAFVAGLAVAETIRSLTHPNIDIGLKWPNDVLIGDQKLAGILIEKFEHFYILGIGLNILAPPDYAAGLQAFSDKRLPINPVRDMLLDILDVYYTRWIKEGFSVIKDQWMSRAAYLNEEIEVRLPNARTSGIFKGIDNDGALILEKDHKTQRFLSGEVFLPADD